MSKSAVTVIPKAEAEENHLINRLFIHGFNIGRGALFLISGTCKRRSIILLFGFRKTAKGIEGGGRIG